MTQTQPKPGGRMWLAAAATTMIVLGGCSEATPPHTTERQVYDAIVAAEQEKPTTALFLEKSKSVAGAGTPAAMPPEAMLRFTSKMCSSGKTPQEAQAALSELYRQWDVPTIKVVLGYGVASQCPEATPSYKAAALALAEQAEAASAT